MKTQLVDYINFKRREGLNDIEIEQLLLARGELSSELQLAFKNSIVLPNDSNGHQIYPDTDESAVIITDLAEPTIKNGKRRPLLWLMAGLGIILLSATLLMINHPRTSSSPTISRVKAKPTSINDTNYQIFLPAGWQASSDYVKGAGVNTFFPISAPNSLSKAQMTIFVLPAEGTMSYRNRIEQQLHGLSQNSDSLKTLVDESYSFIGQSGEIMQITSATQNDPHKLTYHVLAGTQLGTTIYNIDVVVPAYQWTSMNRQIIASIKSFLPKNSSVTTKPRH